MWAQYGNGTFLFAKSFFRDVRIPPPDRGCVEDQPQHVALSGALNHSHTPFCATRCG